MKKIIHCDLAIIGAGAGGLSLAAGASQLGLKVVLIEKGPMGGDCLNFGCVPSKALLAAAKNYWQAQNSQQLGFTLVDSTLDFMVVMNHVRQVINTLAVHDSQQRFESLGVKVIKEPGYFFDTQTVETLHDTIKAKHFVIATGSTPSIPSIPGIADLPYYTNESIFNLTELPKHLLVIGGGPIGCELAQAFAMLGTKVTLIEGDYILNHDDRECVNVIRQSLIEKGIQLFERTNIELISKTEQGGIQLQIIQDTIPHSLEGTHLLVATGRKPGIEGLHCEKASIKFDHQGIHVDPWLRTSNKRIFAIGDVIGHLQFTHVASEHARLVLQKIAFKIPKRYREIAIPWVTYTYPELAHVGLTEKQIDALGTKTRVVKLDYHANDRAQTDQTTKGLIKVTVTPKGKILSATIAGDKAGELIYPWVVAIRECKTLRAFTDPIVPYPTLTDLSKRVAGQFYTPKLFSPMVKKLVKLLSYF